MSFDLLADLSKDEADGSFSHAAETAVVAELMARDSAEVSTPNVTLINPHPKKHGNSIFGITRDPYVMCWVANGCVWDYKKQNAFFNYCAKEVKEPDNVRTNYYHVVVLDGVCVGVIGIHKSTYDKSLGNTPTLTIFLSKAVQGRGVGPTAMKMSLEMFWKKHPTTPVVIDVRTDNRWMLKALKKLGFSSKYVVWFRGVDYFRLVVNDDAGWR